MGKGFGIVSDLNLGEMLLAGYARHCTDMTPATNGHPPPEKATATAAAAAPTAAATRLPRLRIAAITNDTVATYASLAYSSNSRVAMGLVVGTGTNATVPMPVASLAAFKTAPLDLLPRGPGGSSPDVVIVNTEWSVVGTDEPLRALGVPTPWDAALSAACESPGFQPVEYMTAGRYLGELVRLVLVQLLLPPEEGGREEELPPRLLEKNAVSTRFLATAVALAEDDDALKRSLDELYPPPPPPPPSAAGGAFAWTAQRVGLLRAVAEAVQVRSAALVAAMIVGLLARVGEVQLDGEAGGDDGAAEEVDKEELVVAHTGGVILQYPGYLEICEKWIDTLISKGSRRNAGKRVVLSEAKDGGVIGAAVLAGMFAEVR
ncbi:Hexokinase [Neofusicoccum parvum]|nr:Hexokinase [Neofusicoccum parvum]